MKSLYVIHKRSLELEEFDLVKETPRRFYYTMKGHFFDKYEHFGRPKDNFFTDHLEALNALHRLIGERIDGLQRQRAEVEAERQALFATNALNESNEQSEGATS